MLCISLNSWTYAQIGRVETLSFDDYMSLVKSNHPVVQQGELIRTSGDLALQEARGGFDPKISGTFTEKRFKEDPYYNIFNVNVDVPTKTGVKITGGYDRTSGIFLNPERSDPDGGLLYAGVSVPLGRGLLFDERRAQLEKAQVIQDLSEVERNLLINDLILEAGLAYWRWWLSHAESEVFDSSLVVATTQQNAVIESAKAGDRPYIDTVEARIQFQNLVLQRDQAQLNYATASIYLSSYLWDADYRAIMVNDNTIPSIPEQPLSLELMFDLDTSNIIEEHPAMLTYDLKLRELDIQQRLAREYLKPTVDIKYNLLVDGGSAINNTLSLNNFNWGINVAMPLLFRKERAKIKLNEVYISDTEFAQVLKRQEIRNKIDASIAKWRAYRDQYFNYTRVVQDYNRMLEGEQELFRIGESSQFLINSRQTKYIEARLKLNDLYYKIRTSELGSYYAAGLLLI